MCGKFKLRLHSFLSMLGKFPEQSQRRFIPKYSPLHIIPSVWSCELSRNGWNWASAMLVLVECCYHILVCIRISFCPDSRWVDWDIKTLFYLLIKMITKVCVRAAVTYGWNSSDQLHSLARSNRLCVFSSLVRVLPIHSCGQYFHRHRIQHSVITSIGE